jgi:hypothetical protein
MVFVFRVAKYALIPAVLGEAGTFENRSRFPASIAMITGFVYFDSP